MPQSAIFKAVKHDDTISLFVHCKYLILISMLKIPTLQRLYHGIESQVYSDMYLFLLPVPQILLGRESVNGR